MFSRIVGALHEAPELQLTLYGKIVDDVIQELPERFSIQIPKYVIMPNHIHLLIVVENPDLLRALREAPLQKRSLIAKTVGYLKMNVSKRIHAYYPSEKVWQRLYHDHIIRNDQDYREIWEYIDNNPMKWRLDRFYRGDTQ